MGRIACDFDPLKPDEQVVPAAEVAVLTMVPTGAKIRQPDIPIGCRVVYFLPSGVRVIKAMGLSDDHQDWVLRGRVDIDYVEPANAEVP